VKAARQDGRQLRVAGQWDPGVLLGFNE